MHRIIALSIVALGLVTAQLCAPQTTSAQEAVLSKLYGNGVHAYFANDYQEAHKYLTAAIDAGTRDPRAYYFRGLAYVRLGRDEMAAEDFAEGAKLEVQDVNNFYPVNQSLARIQGGQRMMVEDQRTATKLAAYSKATENRGIRYGKNARGDEPVAPGPIDSDGATPIDPADDLFNNDEPEAPVGPDPGIDDPFGGTPKDPPTEPPVDEPKPVDPPASGGDPFGGSPVGPPAGPGIDDPFGGATTDPPAGGGDPFGGAPAEKPAGGDDPFGAGPAVEPKPEDGGVADPFALPVPKPGDEPTETKPVEEPPFGDPPKAAAPGDVKSKAIPGAIGRAFGRAIFGGGGDDNDKLGEELDKESIGLEEGLPGADVPPGEVIPGAGGAVEGGLGDPFGDDPVNLGKDATGGDAPDPFGDVPVDSPAEDDGGVADPFGAEPADPPAADGGAPVDDPFGDGGAADDPFGAVLDDADPFG